MKILDALFHQGGSILVCGSVSGLSNHYTTYLIKVSLKIGMAQGVRAALTQILVVRSGTKEKAEEALAQLETEHRYVEEIFV